MDLKKSKDVIGKTVINDDGFIIGEVVDYYIDVDTWSVTDIQIKIEKAAGKELSLKMPFFGSLLVLVEVEHIKAATDQIMLSLSKDELTAYVTARQEEAKAAKKKKGKDDKGDKGDKGDQDVKEEEHEEG